MAPMYIQLYIAWKTPFNNTAALPPVFGMGVTMVYSSYHGSVENGCSSKIKFPLFLDNFPLS